VIEFKQCDKWHLHRTNLANSLRAFPPRGRYPDVIIPMFTALLPVSAPSDNDWARGVASQSAIKFPTLSETARPVIAVPPTLSTRVVVVGGDSGEKFEIRNPKSS